MSELAPRAAASAAIQRSWAAPIPRPCAAATVPTVCTSATSPTTMIPP